MFGEKRKMKNEDYIVYILYLLMMLSFYYFDVYNLIRGFEGEGLENLGEYIVAIGLSFLGAYGSICYVRKKSYHTDLFGYIWTVIKGCLINVMRFFVAFYCCGCVIHWFVIDILSDFITLPQAFQIDYWNF